MTTQSNRSEQLDPRIGRHLTALLEQTDMVARLIARGKQLFDSDEIMRLAADALVIRMGECVGRIDKVDPNFVSRNPDLELRPLKDTRNLVAHGYGIVDYALVWQILENNVPTVAENVRRFLTSG